MKKFLLLVTAAALTFATSSCSKENVTPTKAKAVAEAAPCDRDTVGTCQIPPP